MVTAAKQAISLAKPTSGRKAHCGGFSRAPPRGTSLTCATHGFASSMPTPASALRSLWPVSLDDALVDALLADAMLSWRISRTATKSSLVSWRARFFSRFLRFSVFFKSIANLLRACRTCSCSARRFAMLTFMDSMTEFPASRWELRCAVNACTAEWVLLDAADALEELPDPVLAVPARGMATVGVGLAPGWGLDGCFRSCPRVLGLPNGCCSAVAVSLTKVNLAAAVTPQARGHLVEPEEASAENNETMPKLGRPISGARCKQTAPNWAMYTTRQKAQCLLPTRSVHRK